MTKNWREQMSAKKKNDESVLGDVLLPLMELTTLLIMQLMKLVSNGIFWMINRYIFKREATMEPKKIERKDLNSSKVTIKDDEIGHSITNRKGVKNLELNKRLHTAIVGASGSGKTALLDVLMLADMMLGTPVVIIDPKGDNGALENFIALCRLSGREFCIFSEHYSGHGAISLNPVKDGSVTNIADRIHHSFTWSEEHYELLCYDALKEAISLLKMSKEELSLTSIHRKLLQISEVQGEIKARHDRKNIQGIITRIKNLIDSDFGPKLSGAEALSFSQLRGSNKCVYIGLSVLGYAEVARSLGKIILGDLAYSVYDTYKTISLEKHFQLTPLGIYIDELSAVITDEFIEILNKCRGAKVEITFAFQSPSDISKVDPNLCVQILENASNWFIFKQRMEEGAALFAEAIGTITSKKQTKRVQDGEEVDQGSQREVEELIAHHNIIKNLKVGQCVLLRHSPTRVDLLNVKYLDPLKIKESVSWLEESGAIDKLSKASQKNSSEKSPAKRDDTVSLGGTLV